MTTIYGISNCDTVKKALKYLDKHNITYQFHDFRKDGITSELIANFLDSVEWTELVNKRSTTYRNLPEDVKNNLNADNLIPLLAEQPTLIKRPVLVHASTVNLGFKEPQYQQIFSL